ncbi:MAG TPA: hypothetical protein GXZ48_05965, partial [Acholeplasmataceae bacterium]|nr:hypothetical protein [Acholeplasmataceae bacterium]
FILVIIIVLLIIYLKWIIRRVGENKKEVYARLNQRAKKESIVFLGDSITEFFRLDEFFSGVDVINRGIAANTTIDVINRLHDNCINISPRKVFLQIGTNDLGEKKKVDYIFENIINIINTLKNALPQVEIIVLSLYPVNNKGLRNKIIVGRRKNKDIDYLNSLLTSYCDDNNLIFIDVASHLKDENGILKKEYTLDGLHLNSYGYLKVTEVINKYVF